jgi:hypothetical protein
LVTAGAQGGFHLVIAANSQPQPTMCSLVLAGRLFVFILSDENENKDPYFLQNLVALTK